jgi:hypothetical protein
MQTERSVARRSVSPSATVSDSEEKRGSRCLFVDPHRCCACPNTLHSVERGCMPCKIPSVLSTLASHIERVDHGLDGEGLDRLQWRWSLRQPGDVRGAYPSDGRATGTTPKVAAAGLAQAPTGSRLSRRSRQAVLGMH